MTAITPVQEKAINDIERIFADVIDDMDELPNSREKSLCITRLEEAQFWATSCVVKEVE